MIDIRNHLSRNEYIMSCNVIDIPGVRKIIKCINELKKNKITVKIYEHGREMELQFLKNWVHSSRETEVQVAAMMILHGNRVIDGKDEIEKVFKNQEN